MVKIKKNLSDDIKDLHYDWFTNRMLHLLNDDTTTKGEKTKNCKTRDELSSDEKTSISVFFGINYEDDRTYSLKERDDSSPIEKYLFGDINSTSEYVYNNFKSYFDYWEKKEKNCKLENYISSLFDYDNFASETNSKWNRHKFITGLGVNVCPYCNRQYISSYKYDVNSTNEDLTIAQADHFYPKSFLPFLSLNLNNLVPSCSTCNNFKKDKKTYTINRQNSIVQIKPTIIYPYEREFYQSNNRESNTKFSWLPYNISGILGNIEENIKITIDVSKVSENINSKLEEQSIDFFRLKELYETHKDYVAELIQLKKIYSKPMLQEIMETYEGLFNSSDEVEEDVYRLVIRNYPNDHTKRPLSKLTKDICDELDIRF